MLNRVRQVSLASVILLALCVSTASVAASKKELVNEFYHRSGLKQQLDWMQNNFADARALFGDDVNSKDPATQKMVAQLDRSLKEKFSDPQIRRIVLDQLDRDLSVHQLEKILEVMDSPIWQHAWEVEGRAYQPGGIAQMQKYIAQNLETRQPRNARVDMINELIEVTGAIDLTLEMAVQGALMASRLMLANMGKTDFTERQMEDSARRQMGKYRDQYHEMLVSQMLYIYRHMSDSQLKAYIELYSSALMQQLNSSVKSALLAVIH